jgi:hypothetical protein
MHWRFWATDWFTNQGGDSRADDEREAERQRKAVLRGDGEDTDDNENSKRRELSEERNRNIFRDEWFCDGSYFSDDGMTIHKADGEPFCYFVDVTSTFHSYATGKMLFYYDPCGENLFPANLPHTAHRT